MIKMEMMQFIKGATQKAFYAIHIAIKGGPGTHVIISFRLKGALPSFSRKLLISLFKCILQTVHMIWLICIIEFRCIFFFSEIWDNRISIQLCRHRGVGGCSHLHPLRCIPWWISADRFTSFHDWCRSVCYRAFL